MGEKTHAHARAHTKNAEKYEHRLGGELVDDLCVDVIARVSC